MVKILLVDDHSIFRRGVKDILIDEFTLTEIGEADCNDTCLELVQNQDWDVVILDLNLPGRNGLEILKDLKQFHPNLPVVLLSFYPESQYAVRALKAGAAGYLSKESVAADLVDAIKRVLDGGSYVSNFMVDNLVGSLNQRKGALSSHQRLSDRELAVYEALVNGQTISNIALHLHVSPKTISTYKARIMEKMELQSQADLIRYALDHKIFESTIST